MKRKFGTRELVTSAAILAICIVSQLLKNISVMITGPIINAALIIAVLSCGLVSALILSVITPLTSFLITGSPVMKVLPGIIPLIMAGNAILVIMVYCLMNTIGKKNGNAGLVAGMVSGSLLKAVFMGLTISLGIIGTMLPAPLIKMQPLLEKQFSLIQLITALIGSVYAFIIWIPLKKMYNNEMSD